MFGYRNSNAWWELSWRSWTSNAIEAVAWTSRLIFGNIATNSLDGCSWGLVVKGLREHTGISKCTTENHFHSGDHATMLLAKVYKDQLYLHNKETCPTRVTRQLKNEQQILWYIKTQHNIQMSFLTWTLAKFSVHMHQPWQFCSIQKC